MRLLISLGGLFLIVAGILLRAAFMLLLAVVIFILVGGLYPYAAAALGIPDPTLYAFIARLVGGLFEGIRHIVAK